MSTKSILSCRLTCLQHSHNDIPLPDGLSVNIGRTPLTKIVDPRCSRNQGKSVALTANWSKKRIKVQQLGANPSSVDGTVIGQRKELEVGEDATIFILEGQYPHKVVFVEGDFEKNNVSKTKDEGKRETKTGPPTKDINSPNSFSNLKDELKKPRKRPSTSEISLQSAKKTKLVDKPSSESHKQSHQTIEKEKSDKLVKSEKRDKKDSDSHDKSVNSVKNGQKESNSRDKLAKGEKIDRKESNSQGCSNSIKQKQDIDHGKSSPPSSGSPSGTSSGTRIASEDVWTQHDQLYVFTTKGVESKNKIAGFDIDGTIIKTKSGKVFPVDAHDWVIAFPEIFGKLKQLRKDNFKLVFFTNQLGVARGKIKIEDLKLKIENVVKKLQVPVQVFVATHEGKYRKPVDGMWKKLLKQYNGGISVDTSACLYVGDAAGRPENWEPKKKKDFSCSDRLFALNINVDFKTPDEFFLNHKRTPFIMPTFDPRMLPPPTADVIPPECKMNSDKKEVIVLVGYPASGKSHLARHHFKTKGYVIVNRDTLGSWQKCVKVTKESLVNSSVVVDNTNLTVDERKRYIDCAKEAGVPSRCFVMTTTFDHCRHNEKFREMTDSKHSKINAMIFNQAKSKYSEPKISEGFAEIVKVNFVPKFSSTTLASKYKKFIVEK